MVLAGFAPADSGVALLATWPTAGEEYAATIESAVADSKIPFIDIPLELFVQARGFVAFAEVDKTLGRGVSRSPQVTLQRAEVPLSRPSPTSALFATRIKGWSAGDTPASQAHGIWHLLDPNYQTGKIVRCLGAGGF
jgi:hypothetical protein